MVVAWWRGYGERYTGSGYNSEYVSLSLDNTPGDNVSRLTTVTFKKKCVGIFGSGAGLTPGGSAALTDLGISGTYTDHYYSFSANAGQTITTQTNGWFGGTVIINK